MMTHAPFFAATGPIPANARKVGWCAGESTDSEEETEDDEFAEKKDAPC